MIVADASAVLDLILGQRSSTEIARALAVEREIHVPEHFHVEAISGLRHLQLRGALPDHDAEGALAALADLRAIRYPVLPLCAVVWSLRNELTAYDAAYLALALRLDADLLTTDRGLAGAARKRGRLRE